MRIIYQQSRKSQLIKFTENILTSLAGGGLDALRLLSMAAAAAATAAADDERTSLLTSAADDGSECSTEEEGIGIACCFDRASRTLIGELIDYDYR